MLLRREASTRPPVDTAVRPKLTVAVKYVSDTQIQSEYKFNARAFLGRDLVRLMRLSTALELVA